MLTEAQIERYSRQILLREVGGLGQQRLIDARVAIRGTHSPALEVARRTLEAGGTTIDPAATLVLAAEADCDVRLLPFAVVAGCRRCISETTLVPSEPGSPVLLGSLAALAVQRLILGLGSGTSVATFSGAGGLMTRVLTCLHQ